MDKPEGRIRVVIEAVSPEVESGRFPIKRTPGEAVEVEADIFADGHDRLDGRLLFRREGEAEWAWAPLKPLINDRWRGSFIPLELGPYLYTLEAWVDHFRSWREGLEKKAAAGLDLNLDLLAGAELVREAAERAQGPDREKLEAWAVILGSERPASVRLALALDREPALIMAKYPDRRFAARYGRELKVMVEPERARFSAWYEMFPRSASPRTGDHGTLKDCLGRLDYVSRMGFDVLYLPPIHPIGLTHRKGRNNTPKPGPEDPGSPWAIGGPEGGHTAIHPELGDLDDFRELVREAKSQGLEIALDLAFQCSPDHPYVKEHPEWFRKRPDGSIQYAENPPKRYEDIYPFDFETEGWTGLWEEIKRVVEFWIDQGVTIFRVDNPHTKPFPFWEWLIKEIKAVRPEVIFLSEAFTRPKVMYQLARLGFSQSYNYFPWRNTKWELTQYLTELTRTEVREYCRPNLWTNTPDILPEYLQTGGRPGFVIRLTLAATLGASYGIYGPAFELLEDRALEFGSEEYLDSEKYQIRHWDLGRPDSLGPLITRLNRLRRENPALQFTNNLVFHPVENEMLLCFSKQSPDRENTILVAVNLDPHHLHSGWLELDLDRLGLEEETTFQVHDLLGQARFIWQGPRNYIELDPNVAPAHVFLIRKKVRTERDFDYFL